MSRPSALRRFGVATLLVLLLAPGGVRGQEQASAEKPTIPAEDFAKFERLGSTTLSPDGAWLAAEIVRVDRDRELRVRPAADPDSVIRVEHGTSPAFSADSRWLAFTVGVGEEERERLQEQNEPARSDVAIVDLRTGERTDVEGIARFAFSGDGRFIALRRYPPPGNGVEHEGVDLLVRELATGEDVNFGNVDEYAWAPDGAWLAMTVDAAGAAGNGIRLWDAGQGRLRTLDAAPSHYTGLTWREDALDLAVLRSVDRESEGENAWTDTAHVVMAFSEVDDPSPLSRTYEPTTATGFPDGYRIVPWRTPEWSDDGGMVFVGIQERTPKEETCEAPDEGAEGDEVSGGEQDGGDGAEGDGDTDEETEGGSGSEEETCPAEDDEDPSVEIWHADDVDIVPTQKVRAGMDRRDNDLSVWHLGDGAFVRLEDDTVEDVQVVDGADHAVGFDERPYESEQMFGPIYQDVYTVDLRTGTKERRLERVERFFQIRPVSSGGRYLLWLEDDELYTHDVRSGAEACITCGLETSFVDLDDDHTVEQKPPFGMAGWLEGDEAVLLYDEHDVWRVAPDGSGGERLTRGAEENVRHRRVVLDVDRFTDGIDPDEPTYWALYDDWREMWGFARSDGLDDEPERLAWDEANYGGLEKADSADVYAWRVQDFEDSPDAFVGGPDLDGVQVTRTNPFQDDYAWGRSELVTYTNAWGDTLQGALFYPANYEPGRRYPMITYIYEILSNTVRFYDVPDERSYYNLQSWVQDGYFVFRPDIVYRDRDPGVSAVANIEPAVEAVLETGMIDPERVGLIGHSWGGYQTTFFVTQSDLFAGAVAGAPLTNLFSMYLSVYWNSGGTDARIFEISQGRMEVPFWEDEAAYRRNSPVFHIENMETPLLMAQGTEDGAVDFNQGVEFYNAARRADKDFVFLVYNDENHGFTKKPNQLDYHRRIDEWFAHYLKGEPPAAWITEGVPYLEQPGGQQRD